MVIYITQKHKLYPLYPNHSAIVKSIILSSSNCHKTSYLVSLSSLLWCTCCLMLVLLIFSLLAFTHCSHFKILVLGWLPLVPNRSACAAKLSGISSFQPFCLSFFRHQVPIPTLTHPWHDVTRTLRNPNMIDCWCNMRQNCLEYDYPTQPLPTLRFPPLTRIHPRPPLDWRPPSEETSVLLIAARSSSLRPAPPG